MGHLKDEEEQEEEEDELEEEDDDDDDADDDSDDNGQSESQRSMQNHSISIFHPSEVLNSEICNGPVIFGGARL